MSPEPGGQRSDGKFTIDDLRILKSEGLWPGRIMPWWEAGWAICCRGRG